jgi:L-alanine-DL-glutamate epimerase-like enolase superfamily enzyme
MKITRVRLHLLSLPIPRPVKTAVHDIRAVDTVLVELETDRGAVGVGYCFAFGRHRARALHALVEDLVPLYEGQDPLAARALFDGAWRSINFLGHARAAVMALAALDTACWDLAAQQEDLERVGKVREAIGPETKLLADANQGWDEATAIRVGQEMEPFNLYWLEEPLPYEDLEGCARVAAAIPIPVATGETDYGSLGMKRHLELRAADILMPDLQRMGGITGFLKAATLCEAFHTPLSSHLFMEASCHLLAAAPNGLILEHMDWWQELFAEPLRLVEGHVLLPDKHGIGLGLNRKAIERFKA